MLEIVILIALIVIAYRVAEAEAVSTLLWVGLMLLLGIGSLFIPLPFVRLLIAGAVWFVAFIIAKPATA